MGSGECATPGRRDKSPDVGYLPHSGHPKKEFAVCHGVSGARGGGARIPASSHIPRRARSVRPKAETEVAALDFETDPFQAGRVPQAFLAVFASRQGCASFWSEKETEVIAWAVRKVEKFRGIVFAHNGGKFDFPGYLFKQAAKRMYGQKILFIGSRLVRVKFGEADLRDSFSILPAPLRDYDKGEIDYEKFEKHRRNKFRAEIIDYAKRDANSLRALCLRFISEHGSRILTAASAAMAAIKASGVKIDALNSKTDEKFRAWYYGGMVRAIRPGSHDGLFRVYDIKSAYPAAMLADHALSARFEYLARTRKILPTDFICLVGIANGCFPLRTKAGLSWPTAAGKYYVTGWEYLAAKKNGLLGKHTVKFIERPKRVGNFRNYVLRFYEQKQKAEASGDKAGRLIAKILINSGYGKTAQRPDKWRDFIIVSHKDIIPENNIEDWTEEFIDESCSFAVWSRPAKSPPRYYNVATGASITGAVRARVIDTLARVGDKAFYCDTDSIITGDTGVIETGCALGDWSLEVQGDRLVIAGKKLYGLRLLPEYAATESEAVKKGYQWYQGRAWKIASKGARINPGELERIAAGEVVRYRNKAPTFSFTSPTRWIERNISKTA